MWYADGHLRLVLLYFSKFALLFAGMLTMIVVAVKIPLLLNNILREIKILAEQIEEIRNLLEKNKRQE